MSFIYNLADTWNNVATTFTAIKMNVTDTASDAASLLMDLQVGGASRFQVTKAGRVAAGSGYTYGAPQFYDRTLATNTGYQINTPSSCTIYSSGTAIASFYNDTTNGLRLAAAMPLGWTVDHALTDAPDLRLYRDGADILAQRRSTNPQTARLYGTFTNSTNYRRLVTTMSAAGVAEIKPEGAGTGASGNVLYISGLPTSNPGPGILWNNAGSVVVGT